MKSPTELNPFFFFLSGAVGLGTWACGLFFFRFWQKSRDRLFLVFAFSFWLLAAERVISVFFASSTSDARAGVFLLRLLAFSLILGAIWDKNRSRAATH